VDPIIITIIMKPDTAYFPFPQSDTSRARWNERVTHVKLTEGGYPSSQLLGFTSPRQTLPPQAAPANAQVKQQRNSNDKDQKTSSVAYPQERRKTIPGCFYNSCCSRCSQILLNCNPR